MSNTPLPYQRSLSFEQLFQGESVDHKILMKFLKREGRLSKKLYEELIKRTKHIISMTPPTQNKSLTSSSCKIPSPSSETCTDSITTSSNSSTTTLGEH